MKMIRLVCVILFVLFISVAGQTPEIVVQTGHSGTVSAVTFSVDGVMLASADATGTVKMWDLKTNKEIRNIKLSGDVAALGFSANSEYLYVALMDGAVERIATRSGKVSSLIEKVKDGQLHVAAFDATGKQIAQIVAGDTIRITQLSDGKELFRYQLPENEMEYLAAPGSADKGVPFGPFFDDLAYGGKGTVLIASASEKVALIDTITGKTLRVVKVGDRSFTDHDCLALDEDDKLIAVCEKTAPTKKTGARSIISIRSVATGTTLRSIDVPNGEITEAKFGGGLSGILKTENSTYLLKRWNISTGRAVDDNELPYESALWEFEALTFNDRAGVVAVGGGDVSRGAIHLYDVRTGDPVAQLGTDPPLMTRLRFLGDHLLLGTEQLWDLRNGRQVRADVYSASFSPDGATYVSDRSSSDNPYGTVSIRETRTGKLVQKFDIQKFNSQSTTIDFSPDKRFLVSRTKSFASGKEAAVTLIDARTYESVFTFPDNSDLVEFSPDGRLIAYKLKADPNVRKSSVKVWDIDHRKQISRIDLDLSVEGMTIDPAGKYLAVLLRGDSPGTVRIHNTATGELLRKLNFGAMTNSVSFSPDGKLLAAGAGTSVVLTDLETWATVRTFTAHESTIWAVAFSPDGKRLAGSGGDGQVVFWDLASSNVLGRLLVTGDSDYLILSPDNYYLASRKGAASAIAFRQGARAYPFEQFDIRYNRPDLALKSLGTSTPEIIEQYRLAYQKRLRQNRLTEQDIQGAVILPEVSVDDLTFPTSTVEKRLPLKVTATDAANSISTIYIYINDIPIYGAKGVDVSGEKSRKIVKNFEVELTAGRNRIQVSALNEKGLESVRQTINIRYDGASPEPELYVVAIGVSEYKDPRYNLTYPAKDTENILSLFEKRAAEKEQVFFLGGVPKDALGKDGNPKKSFYKVHKLALTNENAVLEKIEQIRDFLSKARPEDQVVVFISGHGLLDLDKNYYFATHDMDFTRPELRGLSFTALEGLLDRTPSRRKVLLLDTCHAGELDKGDLDSLAKGTNSSDGIVKGLDFRARAELVGKAASPVDEVAKELFADLRMGNGFVVISASGGLEYAYESPRWSGGVFTYSIRLGLEEMNADADNKGRRDGKISVNDLKNYVGKKVVELTDGRQRPNSRRESIEFDFRIY